jgi:hypothetical protein
MIGISPKRNNLPTVVIARASSPKQSLTNEIAFRGTRDFTPRNAMTVDLPFVTKLMANWYESVPGACEEFAHDISFCFLFVGHQFSTDLSRRTVTTI